MSFFEVLILSTFVCYAVTQAPPEGYYTTRYDHIDVENILNQKRLVYYYTECLLDRGPCTPQGIEFKHILPEALRTNCRRCTEKQRFVTLKSIRRLKKEYPDVWSQLSAVWDPTGEYFRQLEASITNRSGTTLKDSLTTIRTPSTARTRTVPTVRSTLGTRRPVENSIPTTPEKINLRNRFGDDEETTFKSNGPTLINIPLTPSSTERQVTATKSNGPTLINIPLTPTSTERQVTTTTTPTIISKSPTRRQIVASTIKRIIYNYDFAVTPEPAFESRKPINVVLKSVNNIIAPITEIAGKVITAGTDFAGMVLNAFGVRKL